MASTEYPRLIDHLVLPVKDVEKARARYEALGFTIAPTAQHPFGTENCCIYFADGTFLEPLGIAHRETCEAAALAGNTFIRNDQAYRFRVGEEGFSHLVLKTNNANADHANYKKAGMSGGKKVRFSRQFETPDGNAEKISFKLAFAADMRSPDSGFFACEMVSSSNADRSALQNHENEVLGLKEVIATEINPTDFQYFLQTFLNQRHMDADSFGMAFDAKNTRVSVLTPDGVNAFYGIEAEQTQRGIQFQGFVLGVPCIDNQRRLLESRGIEFRMMNESLIVPPSRGQGATIVFEANT